MTWHTLHVVDNILVKNVINVLFLQDRFIKPFISGCSTTHGNSYFWSKILRKQNILRKMMCLQKKLNWNYGNLGCLRSDCKKSNLVCVDKEKVPNESKWKSTFKPLIAIPAFKNEKAWLKTRNNKFETLFKHFHGPCSNTINFHLGILFQANKIKNLNFVDLELNCIYRP